MTNSLPPNDRPPRNLRDDEPIALLVVFLAFGAIGYWAFQEYQSGRLSSRIFWQAPVSSTATPANPFTLSQSTQQLTRSTQNSAALAPPESMILEPSGVVSSSTTGSPRTTTPIPAFMPPVISLAPAAYPSTPGAIPTAPSPTVGFFTDVPTTHWAYSYIKVLADRKLVEGFPDNTYRPDEPVTRSAYAAMIDRAFQKLSQVAGKVFKDIAANDPRSQAVNQAVESNFMSGYPDSTFKPDQTISRIEAIAAMAKGLGLPAPADSAQMLQQYRDFDTIPEWAKPKIAAALESQLLVEPLRQPQLEPHKPISRAEAAALVFKGLKFN